VPHVPSPRSHSAVLTETVNGRTGTVHASGRLTAQGADLLRGTLEHLARQGHATVLLDLAEVDEPDGTGASVLRDLRSSVAASGGRLRVVRPPGWVLEVWDEVPVGG
jgi:anti-anti-sigma regulatory factor